MTRLQTVVNALAGAAVLLAVVGPYRAALAQTDRPARTLTSSSAPFLAAGGDKLVLCAVNNLAAPSVAPATPAAATAVSPTLNVTLEILNGVTGAVVAESKIALPPLGSFEPPDPCISFTVAASAFAPSNSLFVARILLNPQPLPPGRCRVNALSASLQAYSTGSTGNPTNIRTISFLPPDPCVRPFFHRGPPPNAVNP